MELLNNKSASDVVHEFFMNDFIAKNNNEDDLTVKIKTLSQLLKLSGIDFPVDKISTLDEVSKFLKNHYLKKLGETGDEKYKKFLEDLKSDDLKYEKVDEN